MEKESENIVQLGDIIKIVADENHKLHESSFYVSYVDPKQSIEIIHIGSMQTHVLLISKGKLVDDEIKQIHIVSRSIHKGYCRQNGLFQNTWVTIDFGGEIPAIVTAQITHLEEDMITLITYPEYETLYLDFEYKGIPKHIPIMKICIRDKPSSYDADTTKSLEESLAESEEDIDMSYTDNGDIVVNIPKNSKVDENYQDELSKLFNETRLDTEEEELPVYQVDQTSQFSRYKIETQINGLLDDLLASVSDANRNDRVMRQIYTHIQRFQELRNEFSTYDEYGQIAGFVKRNPILNKPLSSALLNFDRVVPYIKPVVSQCKLIYDVRVDSSDVHENDLLNSLTNEEDALNYTMRMNYENNENIKYQQAMQATNALAQPFSNRWKSIDTIVSDLPVHMDMDFVVSNDGHFNSTFVSNAKKGKMEASEFAFSNARYLAEIQYPLYNPRTRQTKKATLLDSETLSVNSLLYMPEVTIDYTKLFLPSSSILQKSNKHMNLLYPFALLKPKTRKTMKTEEIILDKEYKPENSLVPFKKLLRHAKLESFQESLEDKTDIEKYKLLLQQVVPNIFTIIHQYTKENKKIYNLSQYLAELEPFYIYYKDVSFKAGETIKHQIRDNIQEYINNYQVLLQEFNRLKLLRINAHAKPLHPIYLKLGFNMFITNFDLSHKMQTSYMFDQTVLQNGEMIDLMLLRDSGKLFNVLMQIASIDLVSPIELLTEDINEDEEFEPVIKGLCKRRNLSKRYSSIKELQDDNDKRELEFDDEFDDTNYGILKQYKNEKDSMENEVFVDFLAEKLVLNHKCPRSISEDMAKTLIRGKKIVTDGDYAILELRPQYVDGDESALSEKEKEKLSIESNIYRTINYYRRVKNVWIYDKDIDENAFIDSNTLLCNVKNACYKKDDHCEEVSGETGPRLRKQTKQEIMDEYSERYSEEIDKKKTRLLSQVEILSQILEKTVQSERFIHALFDLKAFALGQNAVFSEAVVSPHQYLHDLILQPSFDFYKKQEYIIKMVQDYCRDPLQSENPHWKYCVKTNAKLMENSLYKLAIAFQNKEYNKVLQHLCRTLGREEDDYVYDKETGCILKNIEYQEDAIQDYNRGRDIDEDDLEAAFEELELDDKVEMETDANALQKKNKKFFNFDQDTQYFYNLLEALCKKNEGIDIEIESVQETVLQLCTNMLAEKKIFMSEKVYDKQQEERKKKNVKATAPTYKKYISTKKLEVLACSLIVAVQCLIPSVRRRKTFPGCVQSFRGYPLQEGMDDLSTIVYFACVLRKKAKESDTTPWNTVPKKENAMEERLKKMLETFIVPHSYTKNMLDKKRIYEREHANDYVIPESLDVAKIWSRFTPIIVPFSVTSGKNPLRNVTPGFIDELMVALKQGKKAQWDHIGVLNQKIDLLGAGIIETIRKYVRNQESLLMTQSKVPFLQNACCVDGGDFQTPLEYFSTEDEDIRKYIAQCIKNSLALRDISAMSKAYFLNEKRKSHSSSSSSSSLSVSEKNSMQNTLQSYGDKLIYQAFIQYCYFDNDIMPIPEDLKPICEEKLEKYDPAASLEEKIDLLKNNSKRMSQTKFIEMMNIINRRNCIHTTSYNINYRAEISGGIKQLIDLFDNYKKIPPSFIKFVDIFWKLFDEKSEEMDELENVEVGFCNGDDDGDDPKDSNEKKSSEKETKGGAKSSKYDAFINFVTPEIDRLKKEFQIFLRTQNPNAFSIAKLKSMFGKLFPDESDPNLDYIQYCTFMKNYLYSICVEFPLRITSTNKSPPPVYPSSWPITFSDLFKVTTYVEETVQPLTPFYRDPNLVVLITHLQVIVKPISDILKYFYAFFPEQNHKLYVRLFQYLCLIVFHMHIDLSEEETVANETFQHTRAEIENVENQGIELMEVDDIVPVETVSAAIQSKIAGLFEVYLSKILTRKSEFTTLSYRDIMKSIEISAEEEKHSIKEHFRQMSKEERRAEMLMKSLHLGIFNVNNKKLISYGNDQTDLFGAVVSEQQMDALENEVMEELLNPDSMANMPVVEMPAENDPDAEGFHDDPDEDMFDIAENAFEQHFDN